ncbi:MAG: methyltransferase domain-containing protein [Rhodospirillales bacterium]|nr:methyltransferase domain-containing protein [Rhodospirillales bacterium]
MCALAIPEKLIEIPYGCGPLSAMPERLKIMYAELNNIHQRPQPFSVYTADVLWTEPHLSQQMLHYHLNQDTDLASRRLPSIDGVVDWIDRKFDLNGKNVCDLGCGPGLYTQRFAERGAQVLGLDFSANSISYAQKAAREAGHEVEYKVADYLKDTLPSGQDLITMIYCDLCPLSPGQRQVIYQKVRHALQPGGAFLFDVMSTTAFDAREESSAFGHRFMGGFWAEGDYFAFQNTFKYDPEKLVLDQYTIVEAHRTWQVFNWLQHFSEEDIISELEQNGFDVMEIVRDFANAGGNGDGEHFGVIAKRRPK